MGGARDRELKSPVISPGLSGTTSILVLLKDQPVLPVETCAPSTDTAKKSVQAGAEESTHAESSQSKVTRLKTLFFSFAKGEGPYMSSTQHDFYQLIGLYQQLLTSESKVEQLHIDARDEDGNTPLMVAALHNNNTAAQLFLKAGANIHLLTAEGNTAFRLANAGIKKLIIQAEKTKIAKILLQYSQQWKEHSESMLQALDRFLGPALDVDILNPTDNTARLLVLLHQNELARERKDFAKVLDDTNVNILVKLLETKLQAHTEAPKMKRCAITRGGSFSNSLNTLARTSAVLVRSKWKSNPQLLACPTENKTKAPAHHKIDEFKTKLGALKVLKI